MKSILKVLLIAWLAFWMIPDAAAQKKKKTEKKEDIKEMQEELMRELDDLPPEEAEQVKKILQQAQKNIDRAANSNKMEEENDSAYYFPSRNTVLLKEISARILTPEEIKNYAASIYKTVVTSLSAAHQKEINQTVASHNTRRLTQLAIVGWYFNKAPVSGVALAAKAAEKDVIDGVALNNLAALLIQGNVPHKAIPVLMFVLQKNENDPMILNNLGQAYAALGDKIATRQYLSRCIKISPKHPEANNTLAHLEAAAGNNEAAAEYARTALEGGYNTAASNLLSNIGSKKMSGVSINSFNLPDNFNEYKLKLPRLQQLVNEAADIRAESDAFREALSEESEKLYQLYAPLEEKGVAMLESMQPKLLVDPAGMMNSRRPFFNLASHKIMQWAIHSSIDGEVIGKMEEDYQTQLAQLEARYEKHIQAIRKDYQVKMKGLDCGEGRSPDCTKLEKLEKERCSELNKAANAYLEGRAGFTDDYRRKRQLLALKGFYLSSYWGYLAAQNKPMAQAAYYKAAQGYIKSLEDLCTPFTINPPCSYVTDYTAKKEIETAWKPGCPVDISLGFLVGSLKVNCEEAGFSLGEGAKFSFTQNFISKQSTFTIGIGASISKGTKVPGVEGTAEAGLSQELYITYDGMNSITDLGMKFGASVSAGYGFSGSITSSGDGIITGAGASMEGKNIKGSVGYTIGINSGYGPHIDFDEGPLKALFSGEKQVNPKIGVYQSNK